MLRAALARSSVLMVTFWKTSKRPGARVLRGCLAVAHGMLTAVLCHMGRLAQVVGVLVPVKLFQGDDALNQVIALCALITKQRCVAKVLTNRRKMIESFPTILHLVRIQSRHQVLLRIGHDVQHLIQNKIK